MIIEIIGDGITKEDALDQPLRVGARGIVKKQDKYLFVHLKEFDITTLPGGGLEENETLEECCKREVLEETGIIVNIINHAVTLKEYFNDSRWEHHYFLCEFVEETNNLSLTQEEQDLNLEVKWMTLEEILDEWENNMTKHEYGPAIHNREFLGFINTL